MDYGNKDQNWTSSWLSCTSRVHHSFDNSEDVNCCQLIRANIKDATTAEDWMIQLQDIKFKSGKAAKGKVNVYKRYFKCHHCTNPHSSTADDRRGSKNSNCPAILTVTVKRIDFSRKSRYVF